MVLKKILKLTVHTKQNSPKIGPKRPCTARPSTANARARRLPAHQAATWAWAGKVASRLGLKRPEPLGSTATVRSGSTVARRFRRIKTPSVARSPQTLGHFLIPSPALPRPLPLPPPRDGDRGAGAAAGLLAGERAHTQSSGP
jgi:hypothetical protein